jgi:transcriptional regulator with XRE-family HTH domain
MQNEIGLAIRLARVAVGKSQGQVVAKIGIHPSILNMIESGKRIPDVQITWDVLAALNADAPRSRLVTLVLKEAGRVAGELSVPARYQRAAHKGCARMGEGEKIPPGDRRDCEPVY